MQSPIKIFFNFFLMHHFPVCFWATFKIIFILSSGDFALFNSIGYSGGPL